MLQALLEVERKRPVGSQVRWMGLRQWEYEGAQDIEKMEQATVVGKDSKPLGRQVRQTGWIAPSRLNPRVPYFTKE